MTTRSKYFPPQTPPKMKVWGVTLQAYQSLVIPGCKNHQRQVRVIVCAKSQKRAVELINNTRFGRHITLGFFRTYGSETGNEIQLRTANNTEGVWWAPLDGKHRDEYKKAELRDTLPLPSNYGKGPTRF